jgi:hypothetical protein
MDLSPYLTTTRLWEAAGALTLALWGMYKKELQDWFKSCSKRLWARFFPGDTARRITEKELKQILSSGLARLETLLLVLAKEYGTDRVTLIEYRKKDGLPLATCLVEVRQFEMQSVRHLQDSPVGDAVWAYALHINSLPGRWHYVPDVRLLDVAAVRDALIESGVRSAYYMMFPTLTGQEPLAALSFSWHTEKHLSAEMLTHLHSSGIACAAVLLLMDDWKPTSTS